MKTIVYLDGSGIEQTTWADKHVASGRARYATPAEIKSYEAGFERDESTWYESAALYGDSGPSQPSYD